MGTILTYLKWRGDLTFAERAFCDVDNLVFSELAYLDFGGIVPGVEDDASVTLEDAAARFYEQERGSRCEGGPSGEFLAEMANSRRFRDVRLSNYEEVFDRESGTDFCALHIALDENLVYVAFRGTSDSLLGWREDFSMSFQVMPSQKLAAEYLEKTLCREDARYFVGGHSKGGNLALYAAMLLPEEKQRLVEKIYSNDGPGLCPDIVDMERYGAVSEKLVHIVPEFSVIGALFEREAPTIIVKSEESGFHQHDGISWQVEGDRFCTAEARCEEAEYYNRIFDQWIESATLEQRKSFTRDFFDALEAGNAKKRTDIMQRSFDDFETILLSIVQSEGKSKIVIGKFIGAFFSAFRSAQFAELFRKKKALQGLALFAIGLFLMVAPEFAAQCIGGGLGVVGLFLLGKRQLAYADKSAEEQPDRRLRMMLNLVAMCVVTYLIAQQEILLHGSNLLMGGVFLFFAYRWAKTALAHGCPAKERAVNLLFAAVAFVLGMVPIVTAGLVLWRYVFSAGILILLYGVGKILHSMYEEGKQTMQSESYS